MIPILKTADSGFTNALRCLLQRKSDIGLQIETTAREIVQDIRSNGDQALLSFTRRFDQVDVTIPGDLELTKDQIDNAAKEVPDSVYTALESASRRISDFHQRELPQSWEYQEPDGTMLGQRITPMDRAGIYVPGGKAAYPSSVLMTAIPARVAGVREIVMTVPTPHGVINSAVIVAASLAGVDRIFTIGGAQAVAALAYGTDTIPRVDKIVGPGNAYVAAAKKIVFGDVGIDMIAGPSEVVVICDETAHPDWVAMDLFAQAEHDELAQSIAITTSDESAQSIQQTIARLLPEMERRDIIEASLSSQGAIIVAKSIDEAIQISNQIAPEHLELMVAEPAPITGKIKHAGAIFSGMYSAEVLGDYCAGPNHVLPTAGTARFSSPLGAYDFLKRSSVIHASAEGAREMAKIAAVLAESEGLTAHRRSAEIRLK